MSKAVIFPAAPLVPRLCFTQEVSWETKRTNCFVSLRHTTDNAARFISLWIYTDILYWLLLTIVGIYSLDAWNCCLWRFVEIIKEHASWVVCKHGFGKSSCGDENTYIESEPGQVWVKTKTTGFCHGWDHESLEEDKLSCEWERTKFIFKTMDLIRLVNRPPCEYKIEIYFPFWRLRSWNNGVQ